jgi:enoyl-CoA hydratase/carnithine racemase
MTAHPLPEVHGMIASFWRQLARVLVFEGPTVAAINGHAFGGGLFLALACDYRVMRVDRGFLCFPELNLGMRLSKGFAELLKAKLRDPLVVREAVLTGRKYAAKEALAAGMVDAVHDATALGGEAQRLAQKHMPEALGLVRFDPQSLVQMKTELYTDAYRALSLGEVDAEPHCRL